MLVAYEIIVTILFILALAWVVSTRDPINLGALIGGFLLSGFDWLWCSRGFWNATIPAGLTMIPGLDIEGVRYPWTICFIWAVGFGILPLVVSRYYTRLSGALGIFHLPVIFAAAAVVDLVIEALGTSYFGAWKYHQAPAYLVLGVPWSNFWFLGGVLALSYVGLAYVRRWAGIPPRAGFSLSSENTWKGLWLAAGTIWTSAFVMCVGQLFWWSHSHPWIESGRPF